MISVLCFIVLPAPPYNPHQLLFVEKLTDYPRTIDQKLRYVVIFDFITISIFSKES